MPLIARGALAIRADRGNLWLAGRRAAARGGCTAPGCPELSESTAHDNQSSPVPPSAGSVLSRELGGNLPCIRCNYNLRGLSIRSLCPECGLPVRATLLAVVDPMAQELRPIKARSLVGAGLMVWSCCALAAAVCIWILRLTDFATIPGAVGAVDLLRPLSVILAAASGLGALVLIHPHEGIPASRQWLAALGCFLYLPLCYLLWRLHIAMDPMYGPPYQLGEAMLPRRLGTAVVADVAIIGILLSLRPNARVLAARSVLMRTGRVDRQTMMALVAVILLVIAGRAMEVASWGKLGAAADALHIVGGFLVLAGSILFTLGLVGAAWDCWRIRRVVVSPPLSLSQLLQPDQAAATPGTNA